MQSAEFTADLLGNAYIPPSYSSTSQNFSVPFRNFTLGYSGRKGLQLPRRSSSKYSTSTAQMPRRRPSRSRSRPQKKRRTSRAPRLGRGLRAVTTQKDFQSSRRSRVKFSRRKKALSMFRKKVRKAISDKFIHNFGWSVSRSWVSTVNTQAWALLPCVGYRGQPGTSLSTIFGGTPGVPHYYMRSDQMRELKDYVGNTQYFPAKIAPTTNLNMVDWWFRPRRCTIDVTLVNIGTDEKIGELTEDTGNNIEYDLYWFRPKKSVTMDQDVSQFQMVDIQTRATRDHQDYYDGVYSGNIGIQEPHYEPWTMPNMGKHYKWSKLGQGYLKLGEAVRIKKSVKLKLLITRKMWLSENDDDIDGALAWKPGLGGFLAVSWRGVPQAGAQTAVYPKSRLAFMCNWNLYVSMPATNLRGATAKNLYPNDLV